MRDAKDLLQLTITIVGYFLSGGFNPGFNLNAFQSIPAAPSPPPATTGAFANFALPGGRAFVRFVDSELKNH